MQDEHPRDRLEELLDLEHRGWQALCSSSGAQFYDELMTDDAVMVVADGTVLSRDMVVKALSGPSSWVSYRIEEARFLALGDQAAALVYRGAARRSETPSPFVATMTSVYRRIHDRWKLAIYEQIPVDHSGSTSGTGRR